jgi:hypothetical protein
MVSRGRRAAGNAASSVGTKFSSGETRNVGARTLVAMLRLAADLRQAGWAAAVCSSSAGRGG